MGKKIQLESIVLPEMSGQRLDQIAAGLFPDYSRARLQQWIKAGNLTVNGENKRAKDKCYGGEILLIAVELEDQEQWSAQDIALDIVYEDEHLLVINKQKGLVVHPAAGHADGTLLNALLYRIPDAATLPRAGIVHRLDKDTSGLMIVAKTLEAHTNLVSQLQDRLIERIYEAVVIGVMTAGGIVDEPIGRHSHDRKKMAVSHSHSAKSAVTHYRLIGKFRGHTHIRVKLETGRTHQIRVHMSHILYPLVGDRVYGGRLRIPKGSTDSLKVVLKNFDRQALHASSLSLEHPVSGEMMSWQCGLPEDLQVLLGALEKDVREP